jgi:hypothetical protein
VSVRIDHDTASFAARTIRRWWQKMGRPRYGRARSLLITADAGGSNGPRVRLWKWELQHLANRTGLAITVCHFPPGTSKWNKIEHRLFSCIGTNWRGQPLVSLAVIVNLIGATRTAAGLRVRCELGRGAYPKGQDVSDAQMAKLHLVPHAFHGDLELHAPPDLQAAMIRSVIPDAALGCHPGQPVTGLALRVGYGQHPDLRPEFHEDDAVRKAGKECASDHEVWRQVKDARERRRGVLDEHQAALDLGEELNLEPWPAVAVPRGRFSQLVDRL